MGYRYMPADGESTFVESELHNFESLAAAVWEIGTEKRVMEDGNVEIVTRSIEAAIDAAKGQGWLKAYLHEVKNSEDVDSLSYIIDIINAYMKDFRTCEM